MSVDYTEVENLMKEGVALAKYCGGLSLNDYLERASHCNYLKDRLSEEKKNLTFKLIGYSTLRDIAKSNAYTILVDAKTDSAKKIALAADSDFIHANEECEQLEAYIKRVEECMKTIENGYYLHSKCAKAD